MTAGHFVEMAMNGCEVNVQRSADMTEEELHSAIMQALAKFHRNACYPEAMDFELEEGANAILTIAPLRAQEALIEALEPFAKEHERQIGRVNYANDDSYLTDCRITIGDLRKARAARRLEG